MEDAPITVGLILQVVPVLTGLALLWLAISRRIKAEFDQTRSESEAGRRRLYQRIEKLEEDMDRNFVRRTEHEAALHGLRESHDADLRAVHHALEEHTRIVTALAGRIESRRIEP